MRLDEASSCQAQTAPGPAKAPPGRDPSRPLDPATVAESDALMAEAYRLKKAADAFREASTELEQRGRVFRDRARDLYDLAQKKWDRAAEMIVGTPPSAAFIHYGG